MPEAVRNQGAAAAVDMPSHQMPAGNAVQPPDARRTVPEVLPSQQQSSPPVSLDKQSSSYSDLQQNTSISNYSLRVTQQSAINVTKTSTDGQTTTQSVSGQTTPSTGRASDIEMVVTQVLPAQSTFLNVPSNGGINRGGSASAPSINEDRYNRYRKKLEKVKTSRSLNASQQSKQNSQYILDQQQQQAADASNAQLSKTESSQDAEIISSSPSNQNHNGHNDQAQMHASNAHINAPPMSVDRAKGRPSSGIFSSLFCCLPFFGRHQNGGNVKQSNQKPGQKEKTQSQAQQQKQGLADNPSAQMKVPSVIIQSSVDEAAGTQNNGQLAHPPPPQADLDEDSPITQVSPGSDTIQLNLKPPHTQSRKGSRSSVKSDSSSGKGKQKWLLKPVHARDANKKCLVLDLDETLVHSSFKPIPNPDFIIPVEIEGTVHSVYVLKRPFVDLFLSIVGPLYEVVIFTASLRKYADPVIDQLDPPYQDQNSRLSKHDKAVKHRLFRESCINHRGSYVKDLSLLGRPLSQIIIIDNSPTSYLFHPTNAVPVTTWFSDPGDTELKELSAILTDFAMTEVSDVRVILNDDDDDEEDEDNLLESMGRPQGVLLDNSIKHAKLSARQ
ncbi:hypothetical protein MP228_012450 [Amoeboaphelidium protococcarum]|nr:hypothetical protein MP228_012450 [Amoeboaphelidium protococcarum]